MKQKQCTLILICLMLCTTTQAQDMNCYNYNDITTLILPKDKKIVLVGGCFDILHFGHIDFLEKAKAAGDYVVIALEPDERITRHKNRKPIHTQKERAYNLSALRHVDAVILLPVLSGFDDYLELVQIIKPHVIAITGNDPQSANKQKQAEIVGAQLIIVNDRIESLSSSAIYRTFCSMCE